ncbi:MAG TPA: TetR/AcrR family transcriptional regulator [Chitinophaga sp.]|uniref:TetR/AcrR family transcriptional regulator n=1 Tax=Chitinophaga sp. TaxID=1869181 RepID=UPI002CA9CB8F|nr:TetR/AcrR family transcriptional regulator [Chitinophaga sp.]HVI46794.1 TetR/AcrR family transcriptional regulator [Chitinophaga sp.]
MKPKDDKKSAQIFKAVLRLVVQKGLSGMTMGDISREAGIATGTLYVYFRSKDDLINALFAACRENSVQVSFKGYDPRQPYKPSFRTVWLNILRYRLQNFEEYVFQEQCYHSPFITAATREKALQLSAPFYELIKRGQKEELIKNTDTMLLLSFILGAINELVKQSHYSGVTLTRTKISTTFSLCWDAIKT